MAGVAAKGAALIPAASTRKVGVRCSRAACSGAVALVPAASTRKVGVRCSRAACAGLAVRSVMAQRARDELDEHEDGVMSDT